MINLQNVYKIYDNRQVEALRGVNLLVRQGEFIAVMGESGSGKTTLMNILGCLDTVTTGRYCLFGQDVSKLDADGLANIRNRKIGFIFQDFNLIDKLTARENVELPLVFRGVPKEERRRISSAALEAVGLSSRMDHIPSEMSGGQQQRVAIARVIAGKNRLILADEPTGNLDAKSARDVLRIIQALWKEGHTVVLITHDAGIAACAQRIIRIADGTIQTEGC